MLAIVCVSRNELIPDAPANDALLDGPVEGLTTSRVDCSLPVMWHSMMKYSPRADWNVGTFQQTGGNIAEDYSAIVPAISLRPTSQTVIRLTIEGRGNKTCSGIRRLT